MEDCRLSQSKNAWKLSKKMKSFKSDLNMWEKRTKSKSKSLTWCNKPKKIDKYRRWKEKNKKKSRRRVQTFSFSLNNRGKNSSKKGKTQKKRAERWMSACWPKSSRNDSSTWSLSNRWWKRDKLLKKSGNKKKKLRRLMVNSSSK